MRKPATRLSTVVLPKRFVTASSWTAMSSPVGRLFTAAADAEGGRSAGMLNVQYLCETQEDIGKRQQRRGDHDVHDRDRGHRGVGVLAHVVVEGDRKRLRALRGDEQRRGEFVER